MEELNKKENSDLWLALIDSEKYNEIFSLLHFCMLKAFNKRIAEIRLLKENPPSFNIKDLVKPGELLQLKFQLNEFILNLDELFEINLESEIINKSAY